MRVLVLLVVLSRVAFAQAPGQMPAAPAPAPDAVPVMADRWAVGLAIGSLGLTPQTSGAATTSFGMLELGGRWRVLPAIEIGLSLFGGGSDPNLSASGLFADFRYRFRADRPWNVFALAGIGVVSAGDKDGTSDEKAGRGALRAGVGVERRFAHLALEAELRLVAVAKHDGLPMSDIESTSYNLERYGLRGGSLTFGANYYF